MKTGGLADVIGALPKALSRVGHEAVVVLPLYGAIDRTRHALEKTGITLEVPLGEVKGKVTLWRDAGGGAWFLECDPLYGSSILYGAQNDSVRFAYFCRTVVELLKRPPDGKPFDLVHCHDWQAGLIPVYLRTTFAEDPALASLPVVFTIHNLAYQGVFPAEEFPLTGLSWELFHWKRMEYWGKWSFLKGGLAFSDILTTVSERYAEEILTPEFGAGLEGLLTERKADLVGILNGVDYEEWSPENDRYLPARYSAENPSPKEICRSVLLREVGLPRGDGVPLLGSVSRLVPQKGFDLVAKKLPEILDRVRFVLLGSGETRYEQAFRDMARSRPDRLSVHVGYDESLAHRIEGGADLFLMPSQYEPCGLNQIYSLRYGAVPVVRATGGLDDTVIDADVDPARGTGFKFEAYEAEAMLSALDRALTARKDAARWAALRRRGMEADFSWHQAARKYSEVYQRARAKRSA